MNSRFRLLVRLLFAALLTGCAEPDHEPHVSADAGTESGVELFTKNKGILLPTQLQRNLRVETMEVAQKSFTPRLERMAQVYRAAEGSAPAAAILWVHADESAGLRTGQLASIHAIPSPLNVITGALVRVETPAFAASGEIEAVIEFEDASKRFPAGSTLQANFADGDARVALAVPESAIIDGAAGAFVYAANGDRFTRTLVKPGARAEGWVEIVDGLHAGDVVVSGATESLWLIELCALKGGTPCCPVETRRSEK